MFGVYRIVMKKSITYLNFKSIRYLITEIWAIAVLLLHQRAFIAASLKHSARGVRCWLECGKSFFSIQLLEWEDVFGVVWWILVNQVRIRVSNGDPGLISPYRDESGVSSWSSGLEDPRLDEPVHVQVAAPANPAPAANPEVKNNCSIYFTFISLFLWYILISYHVFSGWWFSGPCAWIPVARPPIAGVQPRKRGENFFFLILFYSFSFLFIF